MAPDLKIDVVYLWVDNKDEIWRAEKNKWLGITGAKKSVSVDAKTNARWRDNGELLYSLRSLDKFAPWVNHVYVVTGFGQVPDWMNTDNPKITIVPHEQIMPADSLPTFNSVAIEMCIPNIPGLSEYFLLVNDDMFFNRPLKPDFFYDRRGRARVLFSTHKKHNKNIGQWMESVDEYTQTLILAAHYINRIFNRSLYKYRPAHSIDPYIKSSWVACRNHPMITSAIDNQIRNKFRTNDELQRWLFNLYDFINGRAIFVHSRARKHSQHKLSNFIYNTVFAPWIKNSPVVCTDAQAARNALMNAPVFCINDSADSSDAVLCGNAMFLGERFPEKSQFEK